MEALWFTAIVGGTIVLAAALAVGLWQWRQRGISDRVRDAVTKANYRAEAQREKRLESLDADGPGSAR